MNQRVKLLASSIGIAGLALGTALMPALAGNVNIGNSRTGANSLNLGTVTLNRTVLRLINEVVSQFNVGVVTSSTGNNSANFNTLNGQAMSGGVNFSGGFNNSPSSTVSPIILNDLWNIRADNDTTGSASSNINTVTAAANSIVDIVRNTVFANTAVVNAQTGNNAANANTGSGHASSGNVGGSLIVTNQAPSAAGGAIVVSSGGANVDVGNDTTGANSLNTNLVDLTKNTVVTVAETTQTTNTVAENLGTGNNSASFNTGNGLVNTGSVNSNTTISNTTTSAAPVVVDASAPANVRADNRQTGFSSSNLNTIGLTDNVVVNVAKTTTTTNTLTMTANTGNNSANANTGNGMVTTGSVNAGFNVINH